MFGEEPPVILAPDRLFPAKFVFELGDRIKVNLGFRAQSYVKKRDCQGSKQKFVRFFGAMLS